MKIPKNHKERCRQGVQHLKNICDAGASQTSNIKLMLENEDFNQDNLLEYLSEMVQVWQVLHVISDSFLPNEDVMFSGTKSH